MVIEILKNGRRFTDKLELAKFTTDIWDNSSEQYPRDIFESASDWLLYVCNLNGEITKEWAILIWGERTVLSCVSIWDFCIIYVAHVWQWSTMMVVEWINPLLQVLYTGLYVGNYSLTEGEQTMDAQSLFTNFSVWTSCAVWLLSLAAGPSKFIYIFLLLHTRILHTSHATQVDPTCHPRLPRSVRFSCVNIPTDSKHRGLLLSFLFFYLFLVMFFLLIVFL